jgi:hypothetical protein
MMGMRARHEGFTLIWALVVSALLMMIAASIVQSAGSGERSSRAVLTGTLTTVRERNVLSYSQRLLEANAASLLAALPAPLVDPAALPALMQGQVNGWCGRDPDGAGTGRVRVFFTRSACGTALPGDIPLPAVRVTNQGGSALVELPFVIVAGTGPRPASRSGVLSGRYGAPPASVYSYLSPSSLSLGSQHTIQGAVHTDGQLALSSGVTLTGTVSASDCGSLSAACLGERAITVNGSRTGVTSLAPSPAHPLDIPAAVTTRQASETASLTPSALSSYPIDATTVYLSVLGDGSQSLTACTTAWLCQNFTADRNRTLYRNGHLTTPVMSNWNGRFTVTSLTGHLTVARAGTGPVVARGLSLYTPGIATVAQDITYAQTACRSDVCDTGGADDTFSLQAASISVAAGVSTLHGAYIANTITYAGPLTVFGSLIGTVSGGQPLTLLGDSRAQQGITAPGVPTLRLGWRQAQVTYTQ